MSPAPVVGSICVGHKGPRPDVKLFAGRWALCRECRIERRRGNVRGIALVAVPPVEVAGSCALKTPAPVHGKPIPAALTLAELDARRRG